MFEFEEGLISDDLVVEQLAFGIREHQSQFEQEYQLIAKLAGKYQDSSKLKGYEDPSFGPPQLSFEEFATVKALRMERQALDLMRETMIINGYNNRDLDGYAYRINNGDQLQLEIVGFDFEYLSKMSPAEAALQLERHIQLNKQKELRHGVGFLSWDGGSYVTRKQQAAYLAMLETESILEQGAAQNV